MSSEYQSLYRKYRPATFSEMVGQRHVTQTIANAIRVGRISHAYLFSGPRGTGKTTTARALATALNCEGGPTADPCGKCDSCLEIMQGSSLDVIEFDAASHRGVDDIEDLRRRFQFAPGRTRYKVYIIDEVHQLSDPAFDMLLKVLEEPPPNVVFVLATTETHKVKPTILSRCQRFDFHRIGPADLQQILRRACEGESIKIEEPALSLLAHAADGAARDALSLLEQAAAFTDGLISSKDVRSILGGIDPNLLIEFSDVLSRRDAESAFVLIDSLVSEGKEITQLVRQLTRYLRDLLVLAVAGRSRQADMLQITFSLPQEYLTKMREQAQQFTQRHLLETLDLLSKAEAELRFSGQQRLILELFTARACALQSQEPVSQQARQSSARPSPTPSSNRTPPIIREKPSSAPTKPIPQQTHAKTPPQSKARTDSTDSNLAVIRELWPKILEQLKSENRAALVPCAQNAMPSKLENGHLTLTFTAEFNMSRLAKQENKSHLEKVVATISGIPVKIDCKLRGATEKPSKNTSDPLLDEALEIFPGSEVL